MDLLLHLGQTLDELDAPRWTEPPADATHLVRKVHALRRVPLGELRAADLRVLVSQQVALAYVVPLAVRMLVEEPLLDAYYYEGDLLLATVNVPATVWDLFPELAEELRAVVVELPEEAVAGLRRGAAEEVGRFLGVRQWNS
ncbi:contact-dependent growth inhibition system immunity protein [Streptomyces sp. NBC_00525]|uniref:contact-dependent growth inhibition system immunity protein n=1 Tax=Streptomyces sp. NBC_00525 TaxID=2903660 RepID=UPI002E81F488|nr:contact-dependent growth inhibition system immunity protein [Streptomyces sp. NBC_00525]WUC93375.1 contact-dependent growth inhibition system immunity protein [Streptomyces sp. NBC_00525]